MGKTTTAKHSLFSMECFQMCSGNTRGKSLLTNKRVKAIQMAAGSLGKVQNTSLLGRKEACNEIACLSFFSLFYMLFTKIRQNQIMHQIYQLKWGMAKFTSYLMICILVLPEPKVSLGYNNKSFVLRLRTSASTCAPIRPVNRITFGDWFFYFPY